MKQTCPSCWGAGASKNGRLCAKCNGSGRVEVKSHGNPNRAESRLLRSLQCNSNEATKRT